MSWWRRYEQEPPVSHRLTAAEHRRHHITTRERYWELLDYCALLSRQSSNNRRMEFRPQKHVVIVGAGPAGLLAAIKLLSRGDKSNVDYSVTIVDAGEDYSTVDDISKKRSWMIGLSTHGLRALKTVPMLYDDYVSKVGMPINQTEVYLGAKKLLTMPNSEDASTFVVDRNAIVAALAHCLNDRFKDSGKLKLCYKHKLMFVDSDKRRVFVRADESVGGGEKYINYDLLLGCDGVRSAVRAAIQANHRDFESSISNTFNWFKAAHIDCPPSVKMDSVTVLANTVPGCQAIMLPEVGGKVNFVAGHIANQLLHPMLSSDSADEVAAYMKESFQAFPFAYEDFAKQWVAQPWMTTCQVHCNFYHSEALQAILLGDAAHATLPTIGQGMNTALADAAALDRLLDEHKDDLVKVLPAFSDERVKEGHALTDLSYYANSFSPMQQIGILLSQTARAYGSRWFPSLISPDPQTLVAEGVKLSVIYDKLTKLGRMPAVRRLNDDVKRKHFEEKWGMVSPQEPSSMLTWFVVTGGIAGLAATAAAAIAKINAGRK